MNELEGTVSLVTGANKGIGYAVAEALGARRHTVLVGARDPERGEAAVERLRAAGARATLIELSMNDDTAIDRAMARIDEQFGRLDVLVNNAAIRPEGSPAPPSRSSVEIARQTFAVNVFGPMHLILSALPLMHRSAAPRIVNVSSSMGSLGWASDTERPHRQVPSLSYNVSKTALNSVTIQFANELRESKFKINAADPGFTHTDMTAAQRRADRTPEQAARVIVELATLSEDGPTGGFFDASGVVPW